jgi:hypothetical protein
MSTTPTQTMGPVPIVSGLARRWPVTTFYLFDTGNHLAIGPASPRSVDSGVVALAVISTQARWWLSTPQVAPESMAVGTADTKGVGE